MSDECDRCGCEASDFTSVYAGGSWDSWCGSCVEDNAFYCESCDNMFSTEYMRGTDDGAVCDECYSEHYRECESCGENVGEDYAHWHEGTEAYYCSDCGTPGHEAIHAYHCGPSRRPLVDTDAGDSHFDWDNLLVGFELEVLGDSEDLVDAVHEVDDCESFVHMEEDSSVDYEIVSQPFSRHYYDNNTEMFDDLIDSLRRHGLKSWTGGACGLHVHISKDKFTRLQLVKLFRLVYDNSDQFFMLSGRKTKAYNYSRFDIGGTKEQVRREGRIGVGRGAQTDKYRALNFNPNTVEIRFMRGSLKQNVLHAAIQQAFAFHEFTQTHSTDDMRWSVWVQFLKGKKKYADLVDRMIERGCDCDMEIGDMEVEKKVLEAQERATDNPWVSNYMPVTLLSDVVAYRSFPTGSIPHFVTEMQEYIGRRGKLVKVIADCVQVKYTDGVIWTWPKDCIRLPKIPLDNCTAMSMSRHDYSKLIGKNSTLDSYYFNREYKVIDWMWIPACDEDEVAMARVQARNDASHCTVPVSLLIPSKEVSYYA